MDNTQKIFLMVAIWALFLMNIILSASVLKLKKEVEHERMVNSCQDQEISKLMLKTGMLK